MHSPALKDCRIKMPGPLLELSPAVQNHERDWPRSGDRMSNMAEDSGELMVQFSLVESDGTCGAALHNASKALAVSRTADL